MEIKATTDKIQSIFSRNNLQNIKSVDSKFLQSSVLFGSMVLSMGLTFVSSVVTARYLGPELYGDLKFIYIVWSLLALLVTFGYFHSGSRVLVIHSDIQKIREISGTMLSIAIVMGIIISLLSMLIAYPLEQIFDTKIAAGMLSVAPFILILPIAIALPLILQGTNKIYHLSIYRVLPELIYILCIFVLAYLGRISPSTVIISKQSAVFIVLFFIVISVKPSFRAIPGWWREIRKHNKSYGGPVYRGSLANVASSYVNRLALSYWVDNTAIGFYSLATSLVEPLKFVPNAVATSSFRNFATQKRVSRKALLATITFSIISLILALVLFGEPLSWIYTDSFAPVGTIARVFAFSAILHGFGDLFNRFLGAHGKGNELRNAAYLVGLVNVVGFILLVPIFGTWGAVATAALASITYFVFIFISYKRYAR